MDKIMPLDLLSSIKGASSSDAVSEMFNVIKGAVSDDRGGEKLDTTVNTVSVEDLRSDSIEGSTEIEKELIRKNFPKEKNGFLVVPKVMED